MPGKALTTEDTKVHKGIESEIPVERLNVHLVRRYWIRETIPPATAKPIRIASAGLS